MKGKLTLRSLAVVGLGILVSGCHQASDKRMSGMVGKPAPDFSLLDLDGAEVKLSQFRGQPVVLTFFGYG